MNDLFNRSLAIDLDYPSELELLTRYFNLKSVFGDVRIVKTKHGYHFIVNDVKSDLELRRIFGDCPGRLYHSELRGGDDVLFDYKGKVTRLGVKLHKNEDVDEMNILCYPFVSRIPRGYYAKRYGRNKRRAK